MSSIAWTSVEDAIFAWVRVSSGLNSDKVVWAHYENPTPSLPFIRLEWGTVIRVGNDWKRFSDSVSSVTGKEIRIQVGGSRQVELILQCFGVLGSGNSSHPILCTVMDSLDAYVYDLDLAGVGIGDVGSVVPVSGTRAGNLEPRSRATVNLMVSAEVETFGSYIETIELSGGEPGFSIELSTEG